MGSLDHGRDGAQRRTLERVLARLGLCSRASAREFVLAGRVTLDGKVVRDPDLWLRLASARLELDGRLLSAAEGVYLALHKPKGYVTTFEDPGKRRTVYDLLSDQTAWVAPVGRLDQDTSGLLLFTNDSDWAHGITSPESKLPKRYRVRAAPALKAESLAALERGLVLDDGPTRPAVAAEFKDYKGYCVFELTITEGRNRQVRRMLAAVGSKVQELRRIAIGPVQLGDLASGKTRPLTKSEVRRLRLDGSARRTLGD